MARNRQALIPIYEPSPDPAAVGYPPTLPIEIALKTASIQNICEAYNLTREDYEILRNDAQFRADVKRAHEALKEQGMSFKLKAQLQSEELLKTSWKMIHASHAEVPPAVKADLLKFTIRAAGLDGSQEKNSAGGLANNLQININLG